MVVTELPAAIFNVPLMVLRDAPKLMAAVRFTVILLSNNKVPLLLLVTVLVPEILTVAALVEVMLRAAPLTKIFPPAPLNVNDCPFKQEVTSGQVL